MQVEGDPKKLGRDLELQVADLFSRQGYEAEHIGGCRDHGADVIARRGDDAVAIQVKHRSRRKWIGERAVRDVHAAADYYGCNRRLVITDGTLAPGLRSYGKKLGVELWDGDRLALELASFCVLCEKHVSDAVRTFCLDQPERFGGKVYCWDHQRRLRGVLRITPLE